MKNESIQHIWTVICSQSTIDSESNNLTLVNVIERIGIRVPASEIKKMREKGAKKIAFPTPLEITSLLRNNAYKKAAVFDFRVRMLDELGKTVTNVVEQKIALKEGIKNIRIRNKFNAIAVEQGGDYWFVVELKSVEENSYKEVASVPLQIEIEETENPLSKKD
jgi:hypothetical protein